MRFARWQIAVALVAGCYAPNANIGAPCPDGLCPSGQMCDVDHVGGPTCVLPGTGGSGSGSSEVDSGGGETFYDAAPEDTMTIMMPDAPDLPRPANDSPANPIDVSAGGMFMWDPTNALDDVASPCAASTGPDVFFTITLAAPEVIYFDTFGSSADSVIAIYPGDCTPLGTIEACVDNSCGGTKSQGAWNLTAGTHCIVVDQVGSTGGTTGKLNVVHGRRAGDPLVGASGTVSGDTCNDDNSNNASCGSEPSLDHHYFVTVCPNSAPNLHIETCNRANWDTVLQIRSNATSGSTLQCGDDSCDNTRTSIDATLTGPGLFWAIIDGYDDCGQYTMAFTLQ
ncbi:MAG TPA: hypothetical protein VFV99_33155 [Kofleriaceae bacterium]|nr:hypothetical protein [Kofleriaceae bacterium]